MKENEGRASGNARKHPNKASLPRHAWGIDNRDSNQYNTKVHLAGRVAARGEVGEHELDKQIATYVKPVKYNDSTLISIHQTWKDTTNTSTDINFKKDAKDASLRKERGPERESEIRWRVRIKTI
jgi:hypothetical protein